MGCYHERMTCEVTGEVRSAIDRVHRAIEAQRQGRLVLIIDDEIEGEGDVCIAAQRVTSPIPSPFRQDCLPG